MEWNRATSNLNGSMWVSNHMWFEACRKMLVITFVDNEGNSAATMDITLPTACATTDPTCPSESVTPINQVAPISKYVKPFIDHLDVQVVDRPR
ncbi:hypothetical protein [Streptomyces umbrinus]|uniref:hypothetical protein n=1 Tax=Streptomyces umbrinus TaxID=67370 RepID=UPI0027D7CB3D|nr:hypothetical protein [Streptomyces umbrinus]